LVISFTIIQPRTGAPTAIGSPWIAVTWSSLDNAPRVILDNWLIHSVAYDRARMILELEMNTGERFQHFGVPWRIAFGLVQADDPAKYSKEFIERTYRFERVSGGYYTVREILLSMARAVQEMRLNWRLAFLFAAFLCRILKFGRSAPNFYRGPFFIESGPNRGGYSYTRTGRYSFRLCKRFVAMRVFGIGWRLKQFRNFVVLLAEMVEKSSDAFVRVVHTFIL
jgi:hypothetical protein